MIQNERRKIKKTIFQKKNFKKNSIFFFGKMKKSEKKIIRENALFFDKKTRNCKTWKIEKIEFFCAYCVHTQKFLWDNSLMLCCSPKHFSWFFETFLVLKFLAKKKYFPKKRVDYRNFEKKKNEKWPIFADRPGYGSNILGAIFVY